MTKRSSKKKKPTRPAAIKTPASPVCPAAAQKIPPAMPEQRLHSEITEILEISKTYSALNYLTPSLEQKLTAPVEAHDLLGYYRLIARSILEEIKKKESHIDYLDKLVIQLKNASSNIALEEELIEKNKKINEYALAYDKLKKDFEHSRARSQQHQDLTKERAGQELIMKILPVLDNFERALKVDSGGNSHLAFLTGVKMIYSQLQDILQKEGLAPIKAVGEKFNPYLHEVSLQMETVDFPGETVLEELQKGYYFKDKVLRVSKVKIAKSPG